MDVFGGHEENWVSYFAMLWVWNVCKFIELKICMQWYIFVGYLKAFKIPTFVLYINKFQ